MFKKKNGFPTEVYAIDEIGNRYSCSITEEYRQWIINDKRPACQEIEIDF